MDYRDIEIEASAAELVRTPDKQRQGSFAVRVLRSPAGEQTAEQATRVRYDDRALQAQIQQLVDRKLDRAALVALGRALALLLLPPAPQPGGSGVSDLFVQSLRSLGADEGLRLRLRLPPLLAPLPWEYLYVDRAGGGDGMDGFLALDPRVAIVRHEPLPAPAATPLARGPIKIVAALASADGLPPLDLSREKADLQQALEGQQGISAQFLDDATLGELQTAIADAQIFHFAGHGVFNRQMGDLPGTYTGTGSLALFDTMVDAEQLGINLRGNGVKLAMLGGCETGRRDGVSVWSGIAPALVKAEIPAVVANQFPITDVCAIAFSKQFYQGLVAGMSVERAVSAGRVAAYNADNDGRDWGVPVFYLRGEDGALFGGNSNEDVREQARSGVEAVVKVRTEEVRVGGEVVGAHIGTLSAANLVVSVTTGAVAGDVTGIRAQNATGGSIDATVTTGATGDGGSVTGINIENL